MLSLPPPLTTTTGWWPTARCCRHCRRRRLCFCHHTLALASAVTIAAAFANVIAPPTLLSMVGCCVVCCPLHAALSAVQICQPLPSCSALWTLFLLGCRRLLLTIASCCLSLFYQASIAFAASIEGWLLLSLPARQHTDHITKLKTFPVSTSWTYFDLLRVSTCERIKNLRGSHFFLSLYVVTTSSVLIPTYMYECVLATGLTDTMQTAKKLADITECRRHVGTKFLTCR